MAAPARDVETLSDLSLQDLMAVEVEVTSVARRGQSVKDAAAAIFVLSNADIIRSGATTIPEVLRYVKEAKIIIEQWRQHYSRKRSHSSLGWRPPAPEAVMPLEQRPSMH